MQGSSKHEEPCIQSLLLNGKSLMKPTSSRVRMIVLFCFAILTIDTHSPFANAEEPVDKVMSIKSPAKIVSNKLLLVHYMDWFQSKPINGKWGWHWTMNHFNPDIKLDGRRQIASHYYPLIGPYDSSDPNALKCQLMLIKMAGIGGIVVDWYGKDNYYDYADINKNLEELIPLVHEAGLRFAVCYEDHTVPIEIKGGVFSASQSVEHGQELLRWMQKHLFSQPDYLKIDGKPVLLTFGNPYYTSSQWTQIFSVLPVKPLYISESNRHEIAASYGGFDWPIPEGGTKAALKEQDAFYQRANKWPFTIAAAFPRFHDIYSQAGVSPSLGIVKGEDGDTYRTTLTKALQSRANVVQIVTWNDWGEGTQIEPSIEKGYQDLEITQQLSRKYLANATGYSSSDLRLPVKWYLLCKNYQQNSVAELKLEPFFKLVIDHHIQKAKALLNRCEKL